MGKSSDVALTAGRAVSLDVVAAQEGFMANHNAKHATAMAKAAKDSTDHKTSVWVPRNAVYLQTRAPEEEKKDEKALENFGKASEVTFAAGKKVAKAVVENQNTIQANQNTAHATAMWDAEHKRLADNLAVW